MTQSSAQPCSSVHLAEQQTPPRGILKNCPDNEVLPLKEKRVSSEERLSTVVRNTIHNAGTKKRVLCTTRSSSPGSTDNEKHLTWDEVNIYLTEQQRGGKMRIDEPKTPFAAQYDHDDYVKEMALLQTKGLVVDELDKVKKYGGEDDIPGLELGEPEIKTRHRDTPDSEKTVMVDMSGTDEGELSEQEREKHRKFEEVRRKHYEMKNVKELLGHPGI